MAGYSPHILDDYIHERSMSMIGDVDRNFYMNQPLADIGRGELERIRGGNYGSTLLGGAIRQQGARDMAALRRNQRLGASAMIRAGANPMSNAASILYDRMAQERANELQDRYADMLSKAMPGYIGQAGGWAEATNRNLAQKQALLTNLLRLRQSNMRFEKKKSFWDKLGGALGVIGNIAGGFFGIPGIGNIFGGGGGGYNARGQMSNPGMGGAIPGVDY
jgi:hypothetical protein